MIDFKAMKIESLLPFILLGLVMAVLVAVVMALMTIVLGIGFPNYFGGVSLTEVLLFMILIMQVRLYLLHSCSKKKK